MTGQNGQKLAFYYIGLTRVTPLVESLNQETLEDRRTKSIFLLIYEALNCNLETQQNKNSIRHSDIGIKTCFISHIMQKSGIRTWHEKTRNKNSNEYLNAISKEFPIFYQEKIILDYIKSRFK